ncbi:AraC family transcriptional regulator [Phenylobacterium sp. CCH9-H3]|uniref:AraC family transcriptional regulator n=2 Tax=unclassified Phenylobacterium TaxID=2640670 RepID=UPI00083A8D59|nr:AraC family transcriptional regulator [Phenylobacterium sp. CCH9-H3]
MGDADEALHAMMQSRPATYSDPAVMPFGWIGRTARLAAEAGVDVLPGLADAGVGAGDGPLQDASPVDPAEYLLMCALVINAVDDEMHGAARTRMLRGTANLVVQAMAANRTLQGAIETAVRFFVIAGAYCRIELSVSDGEAHLRIRSDSGDMRLQQVVEEMFGTYLHIQLSHMLGFLLPITRFGTTSPDHPLQGRRHPYFLAPVTSSNATALVFPAKYLAFPCRARPDINPLLEGELAWISHHTERRDGRFHAREADTASAEVFRRLLVRDLGFDACCRELAIGAAELRQRLANEGASFRLLRRAALIERAGPALRAGSGLDDVADALGYSDGRSFRRALKAATGLGIADLRRIDLTSTGPAPSVLARLKFEKERQT